MKQSDSSPIKKEYEAIKKSLSSIKHKKDKVLELYEEEVISKSDLMNRLASLNEEKEKLETWIEPIELKLNQGNVVNVTFKMVKQVMKNFIDAYKETLNREQRKYLLHLLIKKITLAENREIDSIEIQLNNDVVKHFSPPFCVYFEI